MSRRPGLSDLDKVSLSPEHQRMLDGAAATAGGSGPWRVRKVAEARDLLALSQIAPWRLSVGYIDLSETLRAAMMMRVPVPLWPAGATDLVLADQAFLGLTYRQEALLKPQPGFAFVQILAPRDVYHAQVAADPAQPLCLGAQLPAGVRLVELVLMTHGALSMQSVMIDEMNPAGVMNAQAARWWQQNVRRIPLTQAPFLAGIETQESQ